MREMSRKSAVGKVWITMFFALLITAGMMLAGGMKAHASNPYAYVYISVDKKGEPSASIVFLPYMETSLVEFENDTLILKSAEWEGVAILHSDFKDTQADYPTIKIEVQGNVKINHPEYHSNEAALYIKNTNCKIVGNGNLEVTGAALGINCLNSNLTVSKGYMSATGNADGLTKSVRVTVK